MWLWHEKLSDCPFKVRTCRQEARQLLCSCENEQKPVGHVAPPAPQSSAQQGAAEQQVSLLHGGGREAVPTQWWLKLWWWVTRRGGCLHYLQVSSHVARRLTDFYCLAMNLLLCAVLPGSLPVHLSTAQLHAGRGGDPTVGVCQRGLPNPIQ